MKLRLSVRSLLALVVVVALVLGAIFEIRNHSRRDMLFSKVMSRDKAANWNHHEAIRCRATTGAFPRNERARDNRGYQPGILPAHVTDWGAETSFYEYWGQRLGDEADGLLQQLEAVDANLLFH